MRTVIILLVCSFALLQVLATGPGCSVPLNVNADWPAASKCIVSTVNENNQKDVSQMCINTLFSGSTASTRYFFAFDDVEFQAQTTVGCILITDQTSSSNVANYAVCVSVTGSVVHERTDVYVCDTSRTHPYERCTPSATISNPKTCCSVGIIDTHVPNNGVTDTGVECIIDWSDFPGINPYILNACSYASQPNSDPGDCVRTDECKADTDCLNIPDCLKGKCTSGVCSVVTDNSVCGAATTCHSAGTCQNTGLCTRSNYPGTECRPANGGCDVAEVCDNANPSACPADGYQTYGTECRPAADFCDVAESCTGSSPSCPDDSFKSASTVCRHTEKFCDVDEYCTGSAAKCPDDKFKAATVQCRAAADVCDVPENCPGNAADCPADGYATNGTPCQGDKIPCTVQKCTGSSSACTTVIQEDSDAYCAKACSSTCVTSTCAPQNSRAATNGCIYDFITVPIPVSEACAVCAVDCKEPV